MHLIGAITPTIWTGLAICAVAVVIGLLVAIRLIKGGKREDVDPPRGPALDPNIAEAQATPLDIPVTVTVEGVIIECRRCALPISLAKCPAGVCLDCAEERDTLPSDPRSAA